jgi:hypothetical protein
MRAGRVRLRQSSEPSDTRSQWFCSILSREAAGTPVVGLVGCNSHTGSVYEVEALT